RRSPGGSLGRTGRRWPTEMHEARRRGDGAGLVRGQITCWRSLSLILARSASTFAVSCSVLLGEGTESVEVEHPDQAARSAATDQATRLDQAVRDPTLHAAEGDVEELGYLGGGDRRVGRGHRSALLVGRAGGGKRHGVAG